MYILRIRSVPGQNTLTAPTFVLILLTSNCYILLEHGGPTCEFEQIPA